MQKLLNLLSATAFSLASLGVFGCAKTNGSGSDQAPAPAATVPAFSIPFAGTDASFGTGGPSFIASPAEDAGAVADPVAVFTGPLAGPFTDFPIDPVLVMQDGGTSVAPPNSAQLFGPSTQGNPSGGPCLLEPEIGALYPNNWLRPRFAWTTSNGSNLFELRLHVDNQTNDLVVYTTNTQWTMPVAMWNSLRADSQDVPMTLTVRGGELSGTTLNDEALGSSGAIGIAPVGAPGTIVYWAILDGMGSEGLLRGFSVGDESVITVLTPEQVQLNPVPAGFTNPTPCIGCHASTPDGQDVGFQSVWLPYSNGYGNSIASISRDAAAGGAPSFVSAEAGALLPNLAGVPAYSAAHWTTGDRIELLSNTGDLTWVNLEGTGAQLSGIIARNTGGAGDPRGASTPTWSHNGSTIVYTSLPQNSIVNGRPSNGPMDLYSVPYNDKAGGNATPIVGASDPTADEFNAAFSSDDQYLVFDKLADNANTYSANGDEVYVIPSAGGVATRLEANDPPACSNRTSPGVTNSWPRWSPSAQAVAFDHSTYYWVVFSSTRPNLANSNVPQLYVTPIVVDAAGKITTYRSLYLWNQPSNEENHLPEWDVFKIPPVPVITTPR